MGIQFGSTTVKSVYIGSTPVKGVYLGATKIWPSALVWVGELRTTVRSSTTYFTVGPGPEGEKLPASVTRAEKIVFTSGSDVIVIPGDKISGIYPPDDFMVEASVYLSTNFPGASGVPTLPAYESKVEIYYKP